MPVRRGLGQATGAGAVAPLLRRHLQAGRGTGPSSGSPSSATAKASCSARTDRAHLHPVPDDLVVDASERPTPDLLQRRLSCARSAGSADAAGHADVPRDALRQLLGDLDVAVVRRSSSVAMPVVSQRRPGEALSSVAMIRSALEAQAAALLVMLELASDVDRRNGGSGRLSAPWAELQRQLRQVGGSYEVRSGQGDPSLDDSSRDQDGAAMEPPVLLDVGAVARLMLTSQSTVKRLIASGELPSVRVGSRVVRIRRSDLDAFLAGLPVDVAVSQEAMA